MVGLVMASQGLVLQMLSSITSCLCHCIVKAPSDAIVSVGYTLAMYAGQSGSVLSSNTQFVILLSIPRCS